MALVGFLVSEHLTSLQLNWSWRLRLLKSSDCVWQQWSCCAPYVWLSSADTGYELADWAEFNPSLFADILSNIMSGQICSYVLQDADLEFIHLKRPSLSSRPYLKFVADTTDGVCVKKMAGVNFYRFNAKNWQFTVYFAVITQKNWQFSVYFVVIYAFFRCKFYSPKILLV